MNEDDLRYLLALTSMPQIGSVTARKLIAFTGSAKAVFYEKKKNLMKIPGIGNVLSGNTGSSEALEKAEKEIEYMKKRDIRIKTIYDEDYPERLKQCYDAPLILFYRGHELFNVQKVLSVVGTRNASDYGIDICNKLIRELSVKNNDLLIVSGLAYGIDYNAHVSALKYGLKTTAVLAHGLHTVYPSSHRNLAEKIVQNGTLLTDFTTKDDPERNNFLKRNRIIAGIADAVLVVESGDKGGALITAEFALSYNRDVLAVPGRTTDVMSRGCNSLIKNNKAALITEAKDIEDLLGWDKTAGSVRECQTSLFTDLSPEEEKIVMILRQENRISPDIISIRAGWPVSKISAVMLGLEFKGIISVLPGNIVKLN